jgi:hypothetical protein
VSLGCFSEVLDHGFLCFSSLFNEIIQSLSEWMDLWGLNLLEDDHLSCNIMGIADCLEPLIPEQLVENRLSWSNLALSVQELSINSPLLDLAQLVLKLLNLYWIDGVC